MKTSPNKKQKTKVVKVLILIIIFIAVGTGAMLFTIARNHNSANSSETSEQVQKDVNLAPPTQDQKENSSDVKKTSIENANQDTPKSLNVSINSYAKTTAITHVGVDIERIISTGKCAINIVNGNTSKEYRADIQALAQYSTCKGFDIPNSDIGSGTWSIQATITSGSLTGSATSSIKVD